MSRTVLLYCPPPTLDKPSTRAPLALLAVSSMLVKDYHIVILPRDPSAHRDIFERHASDAVVYGASVMTGPQITRALESSAIAREVLPATPVVWGGWHPTIFPEQVAAHPSIDVAVVGQGERVFAHLLADIQAGKRLRDVVRAEAFEDINVFGALPYGILNMADYIFDSEIGERTINYVSSRGCPYNCSYCAQRSVSGGLWYGLDASRMRTEIERLAGEYRINGILFDDANFFIDRERVRRFARLMAEAGPTIRWGMANARLDDVKDADAGYWRTLRRGGLVSVFIGLEPRCGVARGAEDPFRRLAADFRRVAGNTGAAGIRVTLSIVVGYPPAAGAPPDFEAELAAASSFLKEQATDLVQPQLSLFLPFPHAPLYKAALKAGLTPPAKLEEWGAWTPDAHEMPWVPAGAIEAVRKVNEDLVTGVKITSEE